LKEVSPQSPEEKIMQLKGITYTLCLSAGVFLLSGVAAQAQQPGMPQQQQPQQPTMPSQQPSTPTNPGNAPTGQDYAEKAFVTKALEGGDAEVQLGQLAQEKSQSQDVKQFGQRMVNDHGQMGDKWFKPIAKQLGVDEPKGPSKKDKKEIEKLQALSGPDFDKEYISMMVKDHQQDLKDFKDEAQVAQNPNVKQVAERGSSIIAQHLQLIEQIAKNHNIAVDEKGMQSGSL
jgi:putative membrane protein